MIPTCSIPIVTICPSCEDYNLKSLFAAACGAGARYEICPKCRADIQDEIERKDRMQRITNAAGRALFA